MSNTPIQISTDLSKILERIEDKLENLQKDVTDIKVGQARLEEKVEGLAKRIDNQEFVSRGVLIGLIVAIAGGAAKLFGFIDNP
jgi:phosphoribosylcarboxyaminoimidazole (NCAIR) mutase